jgi:hypothetical protein
VVKRKRRPEPVLHVVNHLKPVRNDAGAADLFARILQSVREANERKRREGEANGHNRTDA